MLPPAPAINRYPDGYIGVWDEHFQQSTVRASFLLPQLKKNHGCTPDGSRFDLGIREFSALLHGSSVVVMLKQAMP